MAVWPVGWWCRCNLVLFFKQGDHSLKEHELLEQQKRVMPPNLWPHGPVHWLSL